MSSIAFISDIHSNLDALQAVLADIKSEKVRDIISLGDIVGYGPEPGECLRLVRENCAATVLGNHEAMLLMLDTIAEDDMHPSIRDPLVLAGEQLSPDDFAWLRASALVLDMDKIAATHSSLHQPLSFPYISTSRDAVKNFAAQTRWAVSFHGHTHQPCTWEQGGGFFEPREDPVRLAPDIKYAVNAGSVGQPRDGDTRACYVIYEPGTGLLLHRRVSYDIGKAVKRFQKAGLAVRNYERLSEGC